MDEAGAMEYFSFHKRRYAYLLETALPLLHPGARVLDVGLSAFSRMILRRRPEVSLTTLGFVDERYWTPSEWTHHPCDLNDPAFAWTSLGEFDVIILAEVIEHLYTPPQRILRTLRSALKPGGHLVLQTPNAASLMKRFRILCGENPYEMIREELNHAGHFREYTIEELRALACGAGFEVVRVRTANYFNHPGIRGRAYVRLCNLFPPAFRDGITALLKRR